MNINSNDPKNYEGILKQRATYTKLALEEKIQRLQKSKKNLEEKKRDLAKLENSNQDSEQEKAQLASEFQRLSAELGNLFKAKDQLKNFKKNFDEESNFKKKQLDQEIAKVERVMAKYQINTDSFQFQHKPIPPGLGIQNSDILGYVFTHYKFNEKFVTALE